MDLSSASQHSIYQVFFHFSGDAACADFCVDGVDSMHFAERRSELGLEVEPPSEEVLEASDVAVEEELGLRMLHRHHLKHQSCLLRSIAG